MIPPSRAPWLMIGLAIVLGIVALFVPPIPQPLSYHNFADQRAWLGIRNFGDVASNIAFAAVGCWGLFLVFAPNAVKFADSRERWPYAVMFAGLVLTAVGSAYYHLAPNNDRLVWDRIPIMMVVMALLAAVIGERTTVNAGLWLLPFLQAIGVGSVLLWRSSEARGHGDLRLCAAIQVYAIVLLLLMLLVRPRYTRSSDFAVVVGFYVLAKIFEESDRQVFALGHIVSGHTLKHVAAAAASYFVLRMLRKRDLVSRPVR